MQVGIEKIINSIKTETSIIAVFSEQVKASLSNKITLYVVIDSNKQLPNVRKHFSEYGDLIFFKANITKAIGIYNDNFRLEMLFMDKSNTQKFPNALVFFDKESLLKDCPETLFTIKGPDMGKLIDRYSLDIIEFKARCEENEMSLALKIANDMYSIYGMMVRLSYDSAFAKKGLDGLKAVLPNDVKAKHSLITQKLKIDSLNECVRMMALVIDNIISSLPILTIQYINIDFYLLTKNLILNL